MKKKRPAVRTPEEPLDGDQAEQGFKMSRRVYTTRPSKRTSK